MRNKIKNFIMEKNDISDEYHKYFKIKVNSGGDLPFKKL